MSGLGLSCTSTAGIWGRCYEKAQGREKTNKWPCPRLPRAWISLSEGIIIGRGLDYRSSCFCVSPRPTHVNIFHSPGIILGPGSSTLFIERVTEEDEGVYHCKATNQKGSVESSAYLTVQGKQLLQRATRNSSDICLTFHLLVSCGQLWPVPLPALLTSSHLPTPPYHHYHHQALGSYPVGWPGRPKAKTLGGHPPPTPRAAI